MASIRSLYSFLGVLGAQARLLLGRFGSLGLRKDRHIWIYYCIDPLITQSHILERFAKVVWILGGDIHGVALFVFKVKIKNEGTKKSNKVLHEPMQINSLEAYLSSLYLFFKNSDCFNHQVVRCTFQISCILHKIWWQFSEPLIENGLGVAGLLSVQEDEATT